MLTRKQRDLLLFIHDRMNSGDIAPSFEEMKEALGLKSKSGVHRLISALVERGYLERLPHRARALEVRKLPEGMKTAPNDNSLAAKTTRAKESRRLRGERLRLLRRVRRLGRAISHRRYIRPGRQFC